MERSDDAVFPKRSKRRSLRAYAARPGFSSMEKPSLAPTGFRRSPGDFPGPRRVAGTTRRKRMAPYADISYRQDGRVARITVERPDKLNAYRDQTADELFAAFRSAEQDA